MLDQGLKQKIQWKWILIHVLFHAAAVAALFYFSWLNFLAFILLHYFIMCFGITIGYHRLLSHRSFRAPAILEYFFAILGVLAFQGGPRMWVAIHRAHHSLTNKEGDAHSAKKGFFWSHQKWMWYQSPNGFAIAKFRSWIRDLSRDKFLIFLDRNFLYINLIVFAISFTVLPLDLFLWVIPLRIVFGWHTTWLVNSVAHGLTPFSKKNKGEPINSGFVSFFTCGEGLHENHHLNPSSPSFETKSTEFDFAFRVLRLLNNLKLVKFNKTTKNTN